MELHQIEHVLQVLRNRLLQEIDQYNFAKQEGRSSFEVELLFFKLKNTGEEIKSFMMQNTLSFATPTAQAS